MTKRILLINAYSAENKGDGLLVDASISVLQEAFGPNCTIDVVASYPNSFAYLNTRIYDSKPRVFGYDFKYVKLLLSKFNTYDLVIGVGGGYLRFGNWLEALKTALVMGPQLCAASLSKRPSAFLPQSIGPARGGSLLVLRTLLRRLNVVWVRDDRSVSEVDLPNAVRSSDLALLGMKRNRLHFDVDQLVVISVREHRGSVPAAARELARKIGQFDGYVQSSVGGNDDTEAVQLIRPLSVLSREEFIDRPQQSRVVVAIRLHAALMAIEAGHFVVHLAYERKGFGAFSDLGLDGFVFNVHDFDPNQVHELVHQLRTDASLRAEYDERIRSALRQTHKQRESVIKVIRGLGDDS